MCKAERDSRASTSRWELDKMSRSVDPRKYVLFVGLKKCINLSPACRFSSWRNYTIFSLLCSLGSAADHRAKTLITTTFHLPPILLYCRTRLVMWSDLYIVKIVFGKSSPYKSRPFSIDRAIACLAKYDPVKKRMIRPRLGCERLGS